MNYTDGDAWELNLGKSEGTSCNVRGDANGFDSFTIEGDSGSNIMQASSFFICNPFQTKEIQLCIDYNTDNDEYSTVNMSLGDYYCEAIVNAAKGFIHKSDDANISSLDCYGLVTKLGSVETYVSTEGFAIGADKKDDVVLKRNGKVGYLTLGNDEGFKISRPLDNTEGATITGIKSLTAFTNSSATKVWATDGSTVDLSTKANTSDLDAKANKSDVLLKKSASGGYYIEANNNTLGSKAFATNSTCTASGIESHAEGHSTRTTGGYSHAEGWQTLASGICSHTEGEYNEANGYCSHAQGSYNVSAKDVIHSVGIGTIAVRKNAEYIYAKNNTNSSALVDDPKNGYKYLIGVGGYDGISTDNTTYKSVQEVIADLTARIEQLETKVKALEDANTPA